jgi:hypothetical protein
MLPELAGPAHDGSGASEAVHVSMGHELARQKKIVSDLLVHVGRLSRCKVPKCAKPVLLVWHIDTSAFVPHNPDGTEHNETCGDRERSKHARKQTR